jgi:hypothetical protein
MMLRGGAFLGMIAKENPLDLVDFKRDSDAPDPKSCSERSVGSIPTLGTIPIVSSYIRRQVQFPDAQ